MTSSKENMRAFWKTPRARWLTVIFAVSVLAGAAYGVYWMRYGRYVEYTNDAYVAGNVVQITPRISGTVVSIDANNTQYVEAGQPLVHLDPTDAEVALQRAEAGLARTVRQVRNLFATTDALRANVQVRRTELAKVQSDYERRARLARTGAISREDLQHAEDAVLAARAALVAAQQQLAANRAWVDGTTVADNPAVRAAAAAVHAAYLTYARTVLPAPVSGFVAKRNVQLGEHVAPGTPLMSVVPLNQVWIDANFKESQLADMRVGQAVQLTSDLYGSGVVFHGRVVGFGAGTGAAFALLPAQNATGNWIKIVQRVPVRIALDPKELAAHPLQIGLSMRAYVDIRHDGSPRLPEVADSGPDDSTSVFRTADARAERAVREIIAANDPGAAHLAGGRSEGARNAIAVSPAEAAGTIGRTLRVADSGAGPQGAVPRVLAASRWMN